MRKSSAGFFASAGLWLIGQGMVWAADDIQATQETLRQADIQRREALEREEHAKAPPAQTATAAGSGNECPTTKPSHSSCRRPTFHDLVIRWEPARAW